MAELRAKKRKRSPISAVERDFHLALDRLLEKKPLNKDLKRLVSQGRLNINPTSVAREAGRSRTLIAMENCRLPAVRRRIVAAMRVGDVSSPRTAMEVISSLREQVAELKRQLASSLEMQAEHFLARELAEREMLKWRDAFNRKQRHDQDDAKITSIFGKATR